MKSKKIISLLCAAVLIITSFAGLTISAGAAEETPKVTFDYVANGNKVTVQTEDNLEKAVVIHAQYTGNTLTSVKAEEAEFDEGKAEVELEKQAAVGDKLMVWSDLQSMIPCAPSKTLKAEDFVIPKTITWEGLYDITVKKGSTAIESGTALTAGEIITIEAKDAGYRVKSVTTTPANLFTVKNGVAFYIVPETSVDVEITDYVVEPIPPTSFAAQISNKVEGIKIQKKNGTAGTEAITGLKEGDVIVVTAADSTKELTSIKYFKGNVIGAFSAAINDGAAEITVTDGDITITEVTLTDVTYKLDAGAAAGLTFKVGAAAEEVTQAAVKAGDTVTLVIPNGKIASELMYNYIKAGETEATSVDITENDGIYSFTVPSDAKKGSPIVLSGAIVDAGKTNIAKMVTVAINSFNQVEGDTLTVAVSIGDTSLTLNDFNFTWLKDGIRVGTGATLENAAAGEYRLIATVKDEVEHYTGTVYSEQKTVAATYAISGKITGTGADGVSKITLTDTGSGTAVTKEAVIDTENHTYTISGVANGTYKITAAVSDDDKYAPQEPLYVTVENSNLTGRDVEIQQRLQGTIAIWNSGNWSRGYIAVGDEMGVDFGKVTVPEQDAPINDKNIHCAWSINSAPKGTDIFQKATAVGTANVVVTIDGYAGAFTARTDIVPNAYTVSGNITGTGAAGVKAVTISGRYVTKTVAPTKDNGAYTYSIPDVPIGEYTVTAVPDDITTIITEPISVDVGPSGTSGKDFAAKEKLRGAVSIVPVTAGNDIRPGVPLKANIDNLTPAEAKDGATVKWYFRETLSSDENEITPAADGTYTPSEPGYVRIAAANDDYSGEVSSINTYVYGDEWTLRDVVIEAEGIQSITVGWKNAELQTAGTYEGKYLARVPEGTFTVTADLAEGYSEPVVYTGFTEKTGGDGYEIEVGGDMTSGLSFKASKLYSLTSENGKFYSNAELTNEITYAIPNTTVYFEPDTSDDTLNITGVQSEQVNILKEDGTSYSFTTPQSGGDVTVNVTYEKKKSEIEVTAPDASDGTLSVTTRDGTDAVGKVIEAGTPLTVTVTPAEFRQVSKIIINGTAYTDFTVGDGKSGTTLRFTVPGTDAPVTVSAAFKPREYTLNPGSINTEHGSYEVGYFVTETRFIPVTSAIQYGYGKKVTIFTWEDDGYTASSVTYTTEDGDVVDIDLDDSGYYYFTFTMPDKNITSINVTFKKRSCFLIDGTEDDAHGAITFTPAGEKVEYDSEVKVTYSPDEGYELDTLTIKEYWNEITLADNPDFFTKVEGENAYTFKMPDNDITVTATFKKSGFYSLTPGVTHSDGLDDVFTTEHGEYIVILNEDINDEEYEYIVQTTYIEEGTKITILDTPDEGYKILSAKYTTADGNTADMNYAKNDETYWYWFNMPAQNVTAINLTFIKDSYHLTDGTASDAHGTITLTPSSGNEVEYESQVKVEYSPADGYELEDLTVEYTDRWGDKDIMGIDDHHNFFTKVNGQDAYTFNMPCGDATVTAAFRKSYLSLTPGGVFDKGLGEFIAEHGSYQIYFEDGESKQYVTEQTTVKADKKIIIEGHPVSGYKVSSVQYTTEDGKTVNASRTSTYSNTFSFTISASDVTAISVTFAETEPKDDTPEYEHGRLELSREKNSEGQTIVKVTYYPDNGFVLWDIMVNGAGLYKSLVFNNEFFTEVPGENAYTFVMPESDVNVEAKFTRSPG